MRTRIARLAAPLAIAGLTLLLGNVVAVADPSAAPSASPAASPPAKVAKATVAIVNFEYKPTPLTVAVGTTVTFKNSDPVAHTVTSADGGAKPAFDSGDLPENTTWSHTFTKAGTYPYFCAYHTYMKGTIVVK